MRLGTYTGMKQFGFPIDDAHDTKNPLPPSVYSPVFGRLFLRFRRNFKTSFCSQGIC